mgnify:CR=1 FL=1|jgi:hypothetical protein
MDENEDVNYCNNCKYAKISYTQMLGDTIVPEWYCGLTNDDEYCYGRDYEEYN